MNINTFDPASADVETLAVAKSPAAADSILTGVVNPHTAAASVYLMNERTEAPL